MKIFSTTRPISNSFLVVLPEKIIEIPQNSKQYAMGGVYVALSCVGCILGVLCGKKLAGLMKA